MAQKFKFHKKLIVWGCEAHGTKQSPYLVRHTFFETRFGALLFHKFIRSDTPDHHDHPWNFISIIFWRGYLEETPCPQCKNSKLGPGQIVRPIGWLGGEDHIKCDDCDGTGVQIKRLWPFIPYYRPATWRHRVVLIDEKPAYTMVIRFNYIRQWGFWIREGIKERWQNFKDYTEERGCK